MKSKYLVTVLLLGIGFLTGAWVQQKFPKITQQIVAAAETIMGLEFTPAERDSLIPNLEEFRRSYQRIRAVPLSNAVPPVLQFNPIPRGFQVPKQQKPIHWSEPGEVRVPDRLEEVAFYSIGELAALIRSQKVTSEELTRMFLTRLKKYDPQLHAVITLTEDLAIQQARRADAEIRQGKYRGLLHGIPYGAKDLLAVKGYPTTWGARPYKDQVIEETATVIRKLEQAGAVLVAKLSLGALAWGDVWFKDTTRNPWDLKQGSSGSSAGSAAATAAGLVPFAIGSETWGSIVSPSTRCGTTGLRPTYGTVSRYGAMALSWSMDKLGPIARTVEDCAIVFHAIHGADEKDPMSIDAPFNYDPRIDIRTVRIGYLVKAFERDTVRKKFHQAALDRLRDMGVQLIPIELPDLPIYPMSFILTAEAGAAFDELTRSNRDDLLVRQERNAWPNVFRASRFIPAVEYIQANRLRYLWIQEMKKIFDKVDVYLAPPFGANLLLTNLTGHPAVVLPNGFDDTGHPVSITFIGNLFDEGRLLAVAKAYQDATDFHKKHPPLFIPGNE